MQVSLSQRNEIIILSVAGRVDALTAKQLADALQAQSSQSHHLVVDLSAVQYLGSAGVHALLSALREHRARGGDLRVSGAQKSVQQVLELSGFASVARLFADIDAAVASFATA